MTKKVEVPEEVTTRQAAEVLETTPAYVHWLIRLGKLQATKRLGRLAISRQSVDAYAKRRGRGSRHAEREARNG